MVIATAQNKNWFSCSNVGLKQLKATNVQHVEPISKKYEHHVEKYCPNKMLEKAKTLQYPVHTYIY